MDFTTVIETAPSAASFRRGAICVVLALFLFVPADSGAAEVRMNSAQNRYVADGQWGAAGIRLEVGRSSTRIEYPCAYGEITGRLKLDAKGAFRASGTHTQMRPGPVREGEAQKGRPAVYEGRVAGDRMTLTVTLTDTNELIGTFELRKNGGGRLHRCL